MSSRAVAESFQRTFLKKTRIDFQIAALYDELPMVAFFLKDLESRFVRVNPRLLRILGRQEEWEVLGRSDADFLPGHVAAVYREEDARIMSPTGGRTRITQLVRDADGEANWYLTTKTPIRDFQGKICGLVGVMYETREVGGVLQQFRRIEPALQHIHLHFGESITTSKLAARCHLSERQFLRLFTEEMGEGPMHHLVRQRIHAACRALVDSDRAAGVIALDCGFFDQSAFNRAFRAFTGQTPSTYRKRYLDRLRI